jgi:hypothetical protein
MLLKKISDRMREKKRVTLSEQNINFFDIEAKKMRPWGDTVRGGHCT